MISQNNNAKFAFFYMLSLVALVFMALSTGMIIFQIINKSIADVLEIYQGRFSDSQLKFAISALIISAPIFYLTIRQIFKNLYSGGLDKDSEIRKWLTYFILFASSVVMIGWLIGTLNSFLDGELTIKFFLKAITAIGIAAAVFSFYYHDIKRAKVIGAKDKIITIYLYGSLIIIAVAFIGSLFIVESPTETRNRKLDNTILNDFGQINAAVNTYFADNKELPKDLQALKQEFNYIRDEDLKDVKNDKLYEYNILGEKEYELCAEFLSSNLDRARDEDYYYKEEWPHDIGRQCISQTVREKEIIGEPPFIKEIPMR